MNRSDYPTPWQRKTLWSALTALAIVTIGGIAVGIVWLVSKVLGFLQPILIPFAVAGVLAYLFDPVVAQIVRWGTSRQRAVFFVFAIVTILFAGIVLWITPAISEQTMNLARKIPEYTFKTRKLAVGFAEELRQKYNVTVPPQWRNPEPVAEPSATTASTVAPTEEDATRSTPFTAATSGTPSVPASRVKEVPLLPEVTDDESETGTTPPEETFELAHLLSGDWIQTGLASISRNTWKVVRSSVGGFLGVLGFLLSLIIVPIYLYYFLIEAPSIAESWGEYLPLRASAFKDEVISALSEINGYLIAFFRGQLVVSIINGTATGLGLVFVGLDFGLLIGLLLCALGLIPYLGIILCWVPAVIIASVQGGSWIIPPTSPWWLMPAVVTGIFIIVQQVDGLFITPKIVGESVGLHPMTVMVSVFMWSLLMGGLLGAILAVPMTATLKVLLKRYVWARRFRGELPEPVTEETFSLHQALEGHEEPESLHAK